MMTHTYLHSVQTVLLKNTHFFKYTLANLFVWSWKTKDMEAKRFEFQYFCFEWP